MQRPNDHGFLRLLVGSDWLESKSPESIEVHNPATGARLGSVPLSSKDEVSLAVDSAARAFDTWKDVPISDRAQYLFKMKEVVSAHLDELAYLNTLNHGKTLEESRSDLKRTIENIDAAISVAYTLSKGTNLDQVSPGVDVMATKEPLGAFAIVCPFNFPLMIPFWFLPYAFVLGDTVILKPSELTPLPMQRMAELLKDEVKLPPGVFNLVHGASETVEQLIRHQETKGVAFVGSTPVARKVYQLAGENGKRAIASGGAKNTIVVTQSINISNSVSAIVSSFFGNTGQRCLAGANLVTVGDVESKVLDTFVRESATLRVGDGLSPQTEMGPVVSKSAKERIQGFIQKGLNEGARLIADGRKVEVLDHPGGYYIGASVFDSVTPDMSIAKEEVFGPLANALHVNALHEAIDLVNKSTNYGNMASIFTADGRQAREFRRGVGVGNVGINIGVAAPSAYFPFGGTHDSFFGTLHPQIETVDFFTDCKVAISRW